MRGGKKWQVEEVKLKKLVVVVEEVVGEWLESDNQYYRPKRKENPRKGKKGKERKLQTSVSEVKESGEW
jgi:hypothetical protein